MDAAQIDEGRQRWQRRFEQARAAGRVRDADFTTLSGLEVAPVYGPPEGEDLPGFERIGWPGEFPFTRGLHASGYRGKEWTIRQFAGFGNARQTNERYQMILAGGGGGLSVAFDMPTLMGRDSDDPYSLGEVGHCGVAIDSAADTASCAHAVSASGTGAPPLGSKVARAAPRFTACQWTSAFRNDRSRICSPRSRIELPRSFHGLLAPNRTGDTTFERCAP